MNLNCSPLPLFDWWVGDHRGKEKITNYYYYSPKAQKAPIMMSSSKGTVDSISAVDVASSLALP